jgi:hypothetical protein
VTLPTITAAQYAALRFLRSGEFPFLTDIGTVQGPTVVVMCSDGHQILEKIRHLEACTEHEEEPCQHIIATNGGALVLAEDSPIARDSLLGVEARMDICCLANVMRGCRIKKPRTLILKTHFPCAMGSGLSVAEIFQYQAKGYERIMQTVLPSLKERGYDSIRQIVCHTHVNYRGFERSMNAMQRTYAFNPRDKRLGDLAAYIDQHSPVVRQQRDEHRHIVAGA